MIAGIKRRIRPYFILWTIVMWVALMGEISVGNAVAGLGIGLAICLLLPLPRLPLGDVHLSILGLGGLVCAWLRDLIIASCHVAWLAVRPRSTQSAIVVVPMRVDSELVFSIATMLYNLQPGGTVTDIDLANRTWTVHILDAASTASIEKEVGSIAALERRMIRTFERNL